MADDDTEHEPKLLETLGIDEDLWKSATPTKQPKERSKHVPQPLPIPASYFQSLKNHTPTHSRNPSLNSTPYELIYSPVGLREDESFISLNEGDEKKVEVNDTMLRYSVYVSNDDFEIPEYYQNQETKRTKGKWMQKFKKNGHSNSISSVFNKKSKPLSDDKGHRNTKSVSNVDV